MYRWIDHTAELELAIEAPDEAAVFIDALKALAELVGTVPCAASTERRGLDVAASDRPALLAAWLEELVYLQEAEGFVAAEVEALELAERSLRATVRGAIGEPPPLVKAITYHQLEFRRAGPGYVANVVLDV